MTNEELAVLIKAGKRDYLPQLWEGVRRFVWKQAARWAGAVGSSSGVTFEDLLQAGYLAMVDAVERFDPERGTSFLTIMGYTLKTEFTLAAGLRTMKDRKDPLRRSVSLDAPVNDEEDGDTLGDFIPDPQAYWAFEAVEDMERNKAVEKALQRLTERQRAVIRCRYWQELTQEQTAKALGISSSTVAHDENKALRILRHPVNSRGLKWYW